MSWKTTIRALILILLAINLTVGGALYRERRRAAYLPEDMVGEALVNLSEKNITVSGKPDTRIYTEPIFSYAAQTGFADAARLNAESEYPSVLAVLSFLSGKSLSFVKENVHYFDTPDGLSASVTDENQNPLGTAVLSDKANFEFVCSEPAENPLAPRTVENFAQNTGSVPSAAKKGLSAFFGAVYAENVSYEITAFEKTEEYALLYCAVTLNKRPIYDMNFYAAVRLKDAKICVLNGNLFFSEPSGAYNAALLDGVNILYYLDIPDNSAAEVLSERLFYSFYQYDAAEYYLVPAWEIVYRDETDTLHTVYRNALNGKAVS